MEGAGPSAICRSDYDGDDIPLNDYAFDAGDGFSRTLFFQGAYADRDRRYDVARGRRQGRRGRDHDGGGLLLAHPEIPHGKLRIGFTPDEEIGRGVDFFDVKRFGARFAYTVDGGFEGELEYENFNAASARIVVQGRNIHPGYAKDKMINALQVACEINSLLPAVQRPEHTQDYEGFYHLVGLSGTVEKASMEYIVRDHSRELFEAKKRFLRRAVKLSRKYGEGTISLTVKDQYYNMRESRAPSGGGRKGEEAMNDGRTTDRPSDPRRYRRCAALVHGASVSEPVHGRHELSRQVRVLLARHDGPRRAHDSEFGAALGRVIGRYRAS